MVWSIFPKKIVIDHIEQIFVARTRTTWGDIDVASKTFETRDQQIFAIDPLEQEHIQLPRFEKYDTKNDFIHKNYFGKPKTKSYNSIQSIR